MGKVLSIGSAVKLAGFDYPLIIIGRGQVTQKADGSRGYLDYSAVLYSIGYSNNEQLVLFNQEDITEVIHEGYHDVKEDEFAAVYPEMIKNSGLTRFAREELKR